MTTRIPIDTITIDPRIRRHPGDLQHLQHDINTNGLQRPVILSPDKQLIAGTRRLAACQALGHNTIDAIIADDDTHASALLQAETADIGPGHLPMTLTERVFTGLLIEDLERPAAAWRRSTSYRRRQQNTGRQRQARDIAAEAVGVPRHFYISMRAIALEATGRTPTSGGHGYDNVGPERMAHAAAALALADRIWNGEYIRMPGYRRRVTFNGLYDRWSAERPRTDVPPMPPGTPAAAPIRNQRKAVDAAVHNLTGLCQGLSGIGPIDPATTREEAATWGRDLDSALRVLRNLRHKIREYQHGID